MYRKYTVTGTTKLHSALRTYCNSNIIEEYFLISHFIIIVYVLFCTLRWHKRNVLYGSCYAHPFVYQISFLENVAHNRAHEISILKCYARFFSPLLCAVHLKVAVRSANKGRQNPIKGKKNARRDFCPVFAFVRAGHERFMPPGGPP
jgi:hypothetical protein